MKSTPLFDKRNHMVPGQSHFTLFTVMVLKVYSMYAVNFVSGVFNLIDSEK